MNEDILHLGLLEDEAIALDTGALALAALDHPETDLEPLVGLLTAITERLADLGGAAETNLARAKMLARVIATEFSLDGDRESYEDPANADLIQVLRRRRGLPVSLSILYVAAARRLNWAADALNTPGHVLVRIGADTAPVLIDPFNGGRVVEAEALARLLRQHLGSDAAPSAEYLAPMSNRSVLVRLLLNNASRAEQAGDAERALVLFERITVVAPGNGHGWWERARLQLGQGDVIGARESLAAMLEITRDPARRAHIATAMNALAGSGLGNAARD